MHVRQPPPPRYRSIDDTEAVRIVQHPFESSFPSSPDASSFPSPHRQVYYPEYNSFGSSANLPLRTIVPVQNPGLPLDEDSEMNNFRFMPCCDNDNIWRTFVALGLGQLMSLCLCGTAVGSQLLERNGYNAPAAQSFLNYFLLAFVYGLILVCRNGDHNLVNVLRTRGWKYLILAFVDVEANYIIVYAYQFTNLTSIQLLDCSTIPLVMILSFLFLSVRYQLSHIIGVAICMVGLSCVIYADANGGTSGGSNPLLGDLLCVLSTFFYAISNVSQEFLIKEFDRYEYLGFIGLFGSLISGLQFVIFETKNITAVVWSWNIIGAYMLFTVSMFAFYSMVSVVVEKTSALMFNLAALSADFYTLIASLVIFHIPFKPFYLVSFIIVIIGSIVYSIRKTPQGRSNETTLACRCMRAICPCFDCCRECRPTSPYTIQEVTGVRRSPSASIDHHDTSSSSD
uniref:EamA domain-containing protein n=1 Tax=Panagrellus redivivus TaxID=6233 RepID=A0A7E4V2L6_PANRE